jgi:hypothetical protein
MFAASHHEALKRIFHPVRLPIPQPGQMRSCEITCAGKRRQRNSRLPIRHSSLLKKSYIQKTGATAGLSSSVFRVNVSTAGQASSGTRLFQQADSSL